MFFLWQSFVETINGKYVFTNDEIIVSNIDGRYSAQNGTWIRGKKRRKNILRKNSFYGV
jgi:hypothetical protein